MPAPGQVATDSPWLRELLCLLTTPEGRAELRRRDEERTERERQGQMAAEMAWSVRLASARWDRCVRRWASKHSAGVV